MKELIIRDNDEIHKTIMYVEDEHLIEKYEENDNNQTIEGNIYIGKVQNVLKGLQAAFVDLGNGKNAFIHLKDILPKRDVVESPRTNPVETEYNITDYVRQGMPIIVEVKRDETSNKGARVSTHISLKGRFIVYMPNTTFVTCSQKITDSKKRDELVKLIKSNIPKGTGAIIRTVCENATNEQILEDVKQLVDKWDGIKKMQVDQYPIEIFNSGGILKKLIIDLVDADLDRIVVTSNKTKKYVESILAEIDNVTKIDFTKEEVLEWYSLKKELEESESRKIWLQSGAFITIEKTEALTAIDVNSGKYVGKNDLEQTVFKVNEEASYEIGKQLRLRDIGGIVLIDFIDMNSKEDKDKIIEIMRKATAGDRSRVQIEEFTKLNLLEITRKHICSSLK